MQVSCPQNASSAENSRVSKPCQVVELQNSGTTKQDAGEADMWEPRTGCYENPERISSAPAAPLSCTHSARTKNPSPRLPSPHPSWQNQGVVSPENSRPGHSMGTGTRPLNTPSSPPPSSPCTTLPPSGSLALKRTPHSLLSC